MRSPLALFVLCVAAVPLLAATGGPRTVRLAPVVLSEPLPADLLAPEGRSRWDLHALSLGPRFTRTLETDAGAVTLTEARGTIVVRDPDGGDAALRYLLPDRAGAPLRPGERRLLRVERVIGGVTERLAIETAIVGIGWIVLPSGPREAVLQRLLFLRDRTGRGDYEPDRLEHRWIDPRAGVVAEVSGPPTPDGRGRAGVDRALVVEAVLAGAANLTVRLSDLYGPPLSDISYGWDRGSGTAISSLTPAPGVTTIGDLIALDAWDFSGNTSGSEIAATTTPVNAQETCDSAQCGYTVTGGLLERSDENFSSPTTLDKTNDVVEIEQRTSDVTVWLRAGAEHEGKSGSFGSGESRFCYTTFGGVTRTPVPLWVLSHQDAPGAEFYLQSGDSWSSAPFPCEQDIFNQVCGASQFLDHLYIHACGTHTGTQNAQVLKGGVVTLPSGHTFNALLLRNTADFCVYSASGCSSLFKVDEVRTVNYLWLVPHLGTPVRLQSAQNVSDATSWTSVAQTDIGFGLFPPRSITITGTTDTTVSLSWDPGLDTHRVDAYKVYWDTDPGAVSAYAFDSQRDPAQVSFAGNTATVSGLAPGTTYYVTVTALSTYTDPSTAAATTYESLLYPTQVSGDPAFVYPVEVQAKTTGGTCVPTAEVQGVTVAPAAGGAASGIQICWNPVSDPCLVGYEVLGAATPGSASGFSVVADTDLGTCWSGNPPASYYLVVARGTGGTGPWGAYGR
jgi:hypothetical protein